MLSAWDHGGKGLPAPRAARRRLDRAVRELDQAKALLRGRRPVFWWYALCLCRADVVIEEGLLLMANKSDKPAREVDRCIRAGLRSIGDAFDACIGQASSDDDWGAFGATIDSVIGRWLALFVVGYVVAVRLRIVPAAHGALPSYSEAWRAISRTLGFDVLAGEDLLKLAGDLIRKSGHLAKVENAETEQFVGAIRSMLKTEEFAEMCRRIVRRGPASWITA